MFIEELSEEDQAAKFEEEVGRAKEARAILESPLFTGAVDAMKQEVYRAWLVSDAKDTAGRENLFKMQRAVEKLMQNLSKHIETGKLAEGGLALQAEKKSFLANLIK